MQRFKIPDLVLGALLAVAIFAVGMTTAPIVPKTRDIQQQSHPSIKELDDRIALYTMWLVVFTAVLAISTIGVWIVTWRSGVRQSKDMAGAIAAAREANEISQKTLVADQRAWLSINDLQVEQDVTVTDRGVVKLVTSIRITNFGKTPAVGLRVHLHARLGHSAIRDSVAELAQFGLDDASPWTRILLPNESYRHLDILTFKPPGDDSSPLHVVIGCVTYRILLDDSVHQTATVFNVFECDPATREFTHARWLPTQEGVTPKDRIGSDEALGGFAN